jgi:exonuclease SbcC
LTFELDGKTYKVERSNTDASLVEVTAGGTTGLAVGLSDVRKACERLIGLNYDQFINSFCAEQKNLGFLSFRTAAARQEEVSRMLGFDRLKRAEDLARERRSLLKARAEVLEKTLGNLDELEQARKDGAAQLKQVQAEITKQEKELKELEKVIGPAEELRKKAEQYQTLSNEMKEIGGEANGLKEAVKLTKAALEAAQKDVAELRSLEPKEQEFKRLESEGKEWERRREEDKNLERLQAEAKTLRCEILEFDDRLKELKVADLAVAERDFLGASEALSRLETKVRELETGWNKQRTEAEKSAAGAKAHCDQAAVVLKRYEEMVAKGVCPECGQPVAKGSAPSLDRAKAELEKNEKALTKAQDALTALVREPAPLAAASKELTTAKEKAEKTRSARDAAALTNEQAKVLMSERAKKAEAAAKLEATFANKQSIYDPKKHEALAKSLETLGPGHLRFLALQGSEEKLAEREKDNAAASANLEKAKTLYKALEAERTKLPFEKPDDAGAAVAAHHAVQSQLRDVQSCLKGSRDMAKYAEAALASALSRIEEHKTRAQELEETRRGVTAYDVVAREMRNLREALNRTIGPDLEARASENLNLLTNGRYSNLALNKDFEPTVIEDGVPKQVISGGEEDVVDLALRLALSELIQERNGRPMTLFVLDEVFGALDMERRQSVLDRLASLKGRFRQVLVISHIEEINQVADQALFLTRDSESRATQVSDAPPEASAMLI